MHSSTKALGWAAILTAAHFTAKLIGGYMTNSLALISDAWHLLTDLLSLVLSWLAMKVSNHPPTKWATFGFHRVGILAALLNNLSLIGISFYILYEAYVRFLNPAALETAGMLWLSLLGIGASAIIAVLVSNGAKNNLNMRSVWLHFAGEACASLGILIGGIVIYFTGWFWVDTVLSAGLGLTIFRGAVTMLRDITIILLEGIPSDISIDRIAETLSELPYVETAKDIHVWCLAEESIALSAHVRLDRDIKLSQTEPILHDIKYTLGEKFNIHHVNIQFELQECSDCHHIVK
ncbi:cation diffusion facilitator family transporter [Sporomusa acidovorans]|uniref:Cadmium, cobalt and zinc/H(+)-K(+) antiporter n=1 Tax=Sporomusa acidovorans (strain ATCC 49682 / DSM 3132 / Mol) TaxID=1123286 RepID=A0ABZ3IYP6_SPOA4|nr:cation diffusion facilitator family transporter [Sporomusa acidovorans]OZC17695.1 cadmium, cobalt and zinc/H(+)-K(+) antiporter [Sporomusa acidovorans DSM 3132]SDE12270.1 cobalt-zinc-cadmium efflux system protein [Sporomusa acidovorans]